jgi:type IV pilus assembly protein PilA
MIVVAIVGILAAIAIPAYQDFIIRSKISEVNAALGACKTSYSEYYAALNSMPTSLTAAGCTSQATQYTQGITVSGASITATVGNVGGVQTGKLLTLTACQNSNPASCTVLNGIDQSINSWRCSTDGNPKFYPANCRS